MATTEERRDEKVPTRDRDIDEAARDVAILAARARELAQRPGATSADAIDVLTFSAGAEPYALELTGVLRVERVERVIRVPRSARGLVGLFNLQGRPCALLDAPALLEVPGEVPRARRWGVVLGRRHPELALAADVVEVDRIERPPAQPGPYRLGSTADARILLDAAAFLAPAAVEPGAVSGVAR
jgi:chemotaxis signal transduction protein